VGVSENDYCITLAYTMHGIPASEVTAALRGSEKREGLRLIHIGSGTDVAARQA
jgi:hypothetical protein